MKNYQKALETIGLIPLYDAFGIENIVDPMKHSHIDVRYAKELDMLQELVNRATPMKVKGSKCPKCGGFNVLDVDECFETGEVSTTLYKFCADCGQTLDWERERKI